MSKTKPTNQSKTDAQLNSTQLNSSVKAIQLLRRNSASINRKTISTVLSPSLVPWLLWRHIQCEWLSRSCRPTCKLHWAQDLIKNMSFKRTLLPWSERRAVIYNHYSQHLYNINKGRLFEAHKLLPNNRQVFFIPWVTRLRLITFKCVLRHTQLLTSIPWAVNRESLLFVHVINTYWCHLWLASGCFDSPSLVLRLIQRPL